MGQPVLNVLVIHSHSVRRENVQRFLSDYYFYAVDTAGNAEEAWNLIVQAKSPYQVVLIEKTLPESSGQAASGAVGIDLMQRIKARSPLTEVILLTGRVLAEFEEAEQAGAYRCLGNDFNMTELAILVRHAAEYRLQKSAAREKRALRILIETGASLLGGHTRSDSLRLILKGVKQTGFDRVRLYLLSEDKNYLVGELQVGLDDNFEGLRWLVAEDEYFRIITADPRPHLFRREAGKPGPVGDLRDDNSVAEWACVPVIQDDSVIGRILVDNKSSRRPIVEDELDTLALFAAQAAAIKSRPFEELERRARNLKAVIDVTTAVNSSLVLDETLNSVCQSAVELIGVDHSGLVLFAEDRTTGKVCAEYPNNGAQGLIVPVKGIRLEEQLIETGTPLQIPKVVDCAEMAEVRDILVGLGIQSILIVPVISNGQVIGSFSLDAIAEAREFREEEIEMCRVFAGHVAGAVANARLYEEKQARVERLEKLSQRITRILSDLDSTNLDARLELIAERAADVLNAEVCGVFLVKKEGFLSLEASWGHREGCFERGKPFEVRTGKRSGLTGHIAFEGKLFNDYGEALTRHFAVSGNADDCSPSGVCNSLLAIPLKKITNDGEVLVGLLRASNKKAGDGHLGQSPRFNEEDEWILSIFADAVVAAIESGAL